MRCLFGRRSASADLLHEGKEIADSPVVGDLAVPDTHHIDTLEVNSAMGWSDAEERSFMRPGVGLVGNHTISIGQLPVDLRVKVGKCVTHIAVEFARAGFVGRHVWL